MIVHEVFYGDDDSVNPNILGEARRVLIPSIHLQPVAEQSRVHVVPYSGAEGPADIPSVVAIPDGPRAHLPA